MGQHTTAGVLLLDGLLVILILSFRHQLLVHLEEVSRGFVESLSLAVMNLELLVAMGILGFFLNGVLIAAYAFKGTD